MYFPPFFIDIFAYFSITKMEMHFSMAGSNNVKTVDGTGFLVRKNDVNFLVTNRHNIDYSYYKNERTDYIIKSISASGWKKNGLNNFQALKYEIVFSDVSLQIKTSSNASEDVAVVFLGNSIEEAIFLDHSFLGNGDDLKNSYPGEPVQIAGFPEQYNAKVPVPVVRSGLFAGLPSIDHSINDVDSARRVLIEGLSTDGMSGAPVFALQRSFAPSDQNGISIGGYRRMYLIGINTGHFHSKDKKTTMLHPAHLINCIKADAIDELINSFSQLQHSTSKAL